jgi:rhamnogalacturonyl hydrolase YesR
MIELQPAPQERFLTTSNGAGDLVTDFAAEEENWRVVDVRLPGQRWYALGLPFAFLVLLYEATGEEQYAALARWFFDFQARGIDPWDVPSSGKAAWGCSLLYRLTAEKRYREIALHIADNLLEWQSAEGWLFPHAWRTQPQTHDCALFDVTAEFTLWLALVGANVLARDGD